MITFKQVVQFLKKHKNSGVWIERSQAKVYANSSSGQSEHFDMSSSAFEFLKMCGLLGDNSYGGFKGLRIFDKTEKLKLHSTKELVIAFNEYQNERKNLLRKDLDMITQVSKESKVIQSSLNKSLTSLTSMNLPVTVVSGQRHGRGHTSSSCLKIGNQNFYYCTWQRDYKEVLSSIPTRVEKLQKMIESDEVNDYLDTSSYARAYLGDRVEGMIRSFGLAS